jgi:transcriptional regulator with XRE-family HTH domain
MAWLDQLKESRSIPSDMKLAEKAGISSPSVISGWRTGRTQPSQANLRKIAEYAGVPPLEVYRLAGHLGGIGEEFVRQIPETPLPRKIMELITLYRESDDDTRTVILGQVDFLVNAMRRR